MRATSIDGKFSVLIVSSDQYRLATQLIRPHFDADSERRINQVEKMAVEEATDPGETGVNAEMRLVVDLRGRTKQ